MVYNPVESVSFVYLFLWCHSGHAYDAPSTVFTRSTMDERVAGSVPPVTAD